MPYPIISAYHKEGPGDGSLPFPWNPTTMLSLHPNIREAKEIVLDPPVRCLHRLTGDRRPRQPKDACNLATDYYLVPQFESMENREYRIIRYSLKKAGLRLASKLGEKIIAKEYRRHIKKCIKDKKNLEQGEEVNNQDNEGLQEKGKDEAEVEKQKESDGGGEESDDEEEEEELESWSDDGVSHDRGSKIKRFQWQPRIHPQLRRVGNGFILCGPIPGEDEAESRAVPKPPRRRKHRRMPFLHVVMTGGVDPRFKPTAGDIVLVPPKRQLPSYRIPDGACIMTLRDCDSTFKFQTGDLVMCLGRYVQVPVPKPRRRKYAMDEEGPRIIEYDPFASVTLYQFNKDRQWALVGCHQKDDLHWVPATRDHLYSAGQDMEIGQKCPYGTVRPKLGDLIIRPGAWDVDFDHRSNYRRSMVKWWTPRFQFRYGIVPGTVLVRPFIDGVRRPWSEIQEPHVFWGRAEMFVFRGEHAKDGWHYWGSDHHDCSMAPFQPPDDVLHYVEDTDVDTGGPEAEFRYRVELQEVWGQPGKFVDIQASGYPL